MNSDQFLLEASLLSSAGFSGPFISVVYRTFRIDNTTIPEPRTSKPKASELNMFVFIGRTNSGKAFAASKGNDGFHGPVRAHLIIDEDGTLENLKHITLPASKALAQISKGEYYVIPYDGAYDQWRGQPTPASRRANPKAPGWQQDSDSSRAAKYMDHVEKLYGPKIRSEMNKVVDFVYANLRRFKKTKNSYLGSTSDQERVLDIANKLEIAAKEPFNARMTGSWDRPSYMEQYLKSLSKLHNGFGSIPNNYYAFVKTMDQTPAGLAKFAKFILSTVHAYEETVKNILAQEVMNPLTSESVQRRKKKVAEGILSKISNKVMGAAPEKPKYNVGAQVYYKMYPPQKNGEGYGTIKSYSNGHYIINGMPVNHFEIKKVIDDPADYAGHTGKSAADAGMTHNDIRYNEIRRDRPDMFEGDNMMNNREYMHHNKEAMVAHEMEKSLRQTGDTKSADQMAKRASQHRAEMARIKSMSGAGITEDYTPPPISVRIKTNPMGMTGNQPRGTYKVKSLEQDGKNLSFSINSKTWGEQWLTIQLDKLYNYSHIEFYLGKNQVAPQRAFELFQQSGKKSVTEDENPPDVISVDVPLLIRLFEYAREDAKTDMDLHRVAENLIKMSEGGNALSMQDYDQIVGGAGMSDGQVTDEGVGDIIKGVKRKIAGKESPSDVKRRRYLDTVKDNYAGNDTSKSTNRYNKVAATVKEDASAGATSAGAFATGAVGAIPAKPIKRSGVGQGIYSAKKTKGKK